LRTIIKHANRCLYDASERRAITLLEVAELAAAGEPMSVVDKASGEDITVVTLLQSLLELLKRRSSGGLEDGEVDGLVGALRAALATVAGESFEADVDAGVGRGAGTAGGAA
jgi:hypothetical protein